MLDDATDAKLKIEVTGGSVRSDTSLNDQGEIREVWGRLQLHEAEIKTRRHTNSMLYSIADLLLSILPE